MQLVLEKAEEFKKCIDAIAVLIDEAEFLVDENGLTLKATDPSQISMIDFKLDKKAFKKFDAEKTKIGIDLSYFSQIMSRAKAGEELQLDLEKNDARLSLTFKGASTRYFSIPLIDISQQDLPSPKIEFSAELKLKAGVLQDALKDANLISTHVMLGVEGDKFFVRASSSKGNLNNETAKDGKSLLELKAKEKAQSMFPLDYLNDMLKNAPSDSEVELKLKSNSPIEVSYPIGGANIVYFLAPRIESE